MITLDEANKVVRDSNSSGSGCYREVWIVGDLVIKRNIAAGYDCNSEELTNYHIVKNDFPRTVTFFGTAVKIDIPEMTMLGEYLIAKYIDGEHFEKPTVETDVVDRFMSERYGLVDIHEGNVIFDGDTYWVVDLGG